MNKSEGGGNVQEDQSVLTNQKIEERMPRINEIFKLLILESTFLIEEKVEIATRGVRGKRRMEIQVEVVAHRYFRMFQGNNS